MQPKIVLVNKNALKIIMLRMLMQIDGNIFQAEDIHGTIKITMKLSAC